MKPATCVICHVSCVMGHVSCVAYHMSHVMFHLSPVPCHLSPFKCQLSHVTNTNNPWSEHRYKLLLYKIMKYSFAIIKLLKGKLILKVKSGSVLELDGVGPVDNRPSPDKLHHFVKKIKIKKIVTPDT